MLHGKVNIKLIDADTKEVIQEQESTNLVTQGFEQYLGAKSICFLGINWLYQLSPLIKQGYGGLMIFSDELTESSLVTIWNENQRLLGAGGDNTSGSNYRTNWMGKTTKTTLNGASASREWTFEKARCNDVIKALALTNVQAFNGSTDYGDPAFVFNDSNTDSALSVIKKGWQGHTVYALPSGKGILLLSARMSNTTSVTLDTYRIDDVLSVSGQMGNYSRIHRQSILVAGSNPITEYWKVRWGMCDDYHISGHIVQDGVLHYFIFDCTTLGQDTTVEIGSINLPVAFSSIKNGVIKGGYYYFMAQTLSHDQYISVLVKMNLATGAYVHYLWSTTPGNERDLYLSIGGGLMYGVLLGTTFAYGYLQPEFWTDFEQISALSDSLPVSVETESSIPSTSTYNTFDIMPRSRCGGYTPYVGVEKCQPNAGKYDRDDSSFVPYSGITANRAYLATVFNLPTPITKTDAQELVVEYTLTEA